MDREGVEWMIAQAILKEASTMDEDRRRAGIQGHGISVANALGQLFRRAKKK